MSLGFQQAGCVIEAAVEIDGWAAETYRANLGDHLFETSVAEFLNSPEAKISSLDVLIGGPPCQGFSISSRSKTRKAFDERNDEVLTFISAAEVFKPKYIVFENVPQFQSFVDSTGKHYSALLVDGLSSLGYEFFIRVLNASDFGVPQNRQRAIGIGIRSDLIASPGLNFADQVGSQLRKSKPIGCWDAISDLPEVAPRALSEDAIQKYVLPPQNSFQAEMRNGSEEIYNHIPMRHTPRLVERFRKIEQGKSGIDVWEDSSPRKRSDRDSSGTKFEQNHRRMDPNKPSPTIAAHMYSTCLHPFQHRNITIREAARLQSFPDTFRFFGKRTTLSRKLLEKKGLSGDAKLNQLNQVGNAVPPKLARCIAEHIQNMEQSLNVKCA